MGLKHGPAAEVATGLRPYVPPRLFTQQFLNHWRHSLGPDLVALGSWVQKVSHHASGNQPIRVQKLPADIEIGDVIPAIERGEKTIDFVDL